ncbi:MAG: hypothetical protein ACXVGF_04830 [Blastococcus sp.]
MAIFATALTTGADGTNRTGSYTTASITPAANQLVLAAVLLSVGSGTPPTPTLTGNGLTWVLVTQSPAAQRMVYLFRAMGSAPTAGAVSIAGDGTTTVTSCMWQITQLSGVDTSGTSGSGAIVQFVNAKPTSVSSVSVGFPNAIGSGNATYGAVGVAVQESPAAGSGWTSMGATNLSAPTSGLLGESAATGQRNITASWTTAANAFVVGAEVKASSGPSPVWLTAAPATATARALAGTVNLGRAVTLSAPTVIVSASAPAGTVNTGTPTVRQTPAVISTDKFRSGGYALWYTVDASRGGAPVTGATGLQPVGGSITDTMKPGPRRTLSVDLPQLPGLYDLLSPPGTTLTVTAHVRDLGRQQTDIPMGVYDIDSLTVDDAAGKISITAPDMWARIARAKFVGPVSSNLGTLVTTQIVKLIQGALGASTVVTVQSASQTQTPPLTWEKDRDKAIIDLANGIGAWVFADESGNWTIKDLPTGGQDPKWLIDANPAGVLVNSRRETSRTSTYNVVCVEPQSASNPTFSTTWVWDTDPNSPTYAGPIGNMTTPPDPSQAGPFGLSVYYYDTALPLDPLQAKNLAYTILSKTVSTAQQVSVDAALNPYMQAGDVFTVLPRRERYDLERLPERHVADTVTHPLVVDTNTLMHVDGRSNRTDPYT